MNKQLFQLRHRDGFVIDGLTYEEAKKKQQDALKCNPSLKVILEPQFKRKYS